MCGEEGPGLEKKSWLCKKEPETFIHAKASNVERREEKMNAFLLFFP